ncbi:orotidine 5'-phosphate decarboxylase [Limihaloglobus sulfuriphilus]|uniref:Orotidine-5'-phosphate decarboxylase n=1 Tax=Limihaloglobus sulfuriphilus TaxID=1851148 RepID=A0A1Q2MD19_9BACT|nr:orotidine-5'-phosphate decarboxylase [Limihaloglobus sulfuriphilus]AQQ70207.1 orotidine 5'-phosphate decarboxylase [Limihaloglobus sulfuriphilus]
MTKHFCDRLCESVKAKNSPLAVGLDPVFSRLPEDIRSKGSQTDEDFVIDAVFQFGCEVIKAVAQHVPAIKLNIAFFERYGYEGIECFHSLVTEAKEQQLEVIGDVKRGDIGHTCLAYADAYLSEHTFRTLGLKPSDAITINGFAGSEGIEPFAERAGENGKGVFVWVRASNSSAARLQDAVTADGQMFYEILADITAEIASMPKYIGESGYSCVGMVVGGTSPEHTTKLREKYPNIWFLVPGFGSQGGEAVDCVRFCKPDGTGALINSSRGIIYAYEEHKYKSAFADDWRKCIEQAAIDANKVLKDSFDKIYK